MNHLSFASKFLAIVRLTLALSIAIFGLVGCDMRTPEQKRQATEKLLAEVGVSAKAMPPGIPQESPTQLKPNSADQTLTPSIVKQSSEPSKPMASEESTSTTSTSTPSNESASSTVSSETALKQKVANDDPTASWIKGVPLPRELWEVQYLGNVPVGYLRRKVEASQSLGSNYLRLEAESRIRVSLHGKSHEQRVLVTTNERDNGELLRLEGSVEIGQSKQTFTGNVNGDLLKVSGSENGQPFVLSIPWRAEYRGPFAVDQSMLRRPLKPLETRKLKYFDPVLRKLIDGTLKTEKYPPYMTPTMLGGSQLLLEVRNFAVFGEDGSESLLWVDSKGVGLKSLFPKNDLRSYRTEAIAAQIVGSTMDLSAIEISTVPVRGSIERLMNNLQDLKAVTYRITHKSADPFHLFSKHVNQRIRSIDPKTIDVTVSRVAAEPVVTLGIEAIDLSEKRDDDSTLASEYIPSNQEQVKKLAKAILMLDKSLGLDQASNIVKADACRKELFNRVALTEFDKKFGTVANTLRFKSADCVEHAALFASVCRALNIPTRVIFGMIFNHSETLPSMKFHAWVEIFDENRWVPMDSSHEAFPTTIDRIKILETNLNGGNPFEEILKAYSLIPELSIQIMQ